MAGTLVSDIVNAVIVELSQVPGTATQIYAAPRIQQYVQDAVLLEMEEIWWPNYMKYFNNVALDGVNGYLAADLTGPISSITEYGDIAAVWPSTSNRKLRQVPPSMNPATLTGTNSLYMGQSDDIVAHPNRPFMVFPATSSDTLTVWARQRPTIPIASGDTLYIDQLLLTYDAAWMYVVDDGTVPGQVDKFAKLAQKRRDQAKASYNNIPLQLDPRFSAEQDQWWELG